MSDIETEANTLLAEYSDASDIDEALVNMADVIDSLRTENATLRADFTALSESRWELGVKAARTEQERATLRELVREALEWEFTKLLAWRGRAEKALEGK